MGRIIAHTRKTSRNGGQGGGEGCLSAIRFVCTQSQFVGIAWPPILLLCVTQQHLLKPCSALVHLTHIHRQPQHNTRTVAQEVVPKNLNFRRTKLSQNAVFQVSVLWTLLHIMYHYIHYKLVFTGQYCRRAERREQSKANMLLYAILRGHSPPSLFGLFIPTVPASSHCQPKRKHSGAVCTTA